MDDLLLDRREMLELVARAASIPAASAFFSAWLKAVPAHTAHGGSDAPPMPDLLKNYQPTFFSAEDFQALEAFTEILIPRDEDPGARDAHCAHFIDFVLQNSGEVPTTQAAWRKAMSAIKSTGFYTADAQKRVELVGEMARPEMDHDSKHPAYFAYRMIKRQTVFAFYTSRTGMIDVLNYKGNSYNPTFPACTHPEHQIV